MCYIHTKPFGENTFTLYTGTRVECGVSEKGWSQLLFKARIKKDNVYQGIKILQGARIYDEKGKECGRVTIDVNPFRMIEENDTCFTMEIGGFALTASIDESSVAEKQLEQIFAKPVNVYPIDSFREHLARFSYQPWVHDHTITSYLLMETDMIKPRPGIRVVLVFDGDRAVALFYRRNMTIRKFESVAITSKYSLLYLGSFNETFKKRLSDILIPQIDALY